MRQVLGPGALGRPRGIGWKGRWEEGSGWGIHVTPWLIHVNVWQNPLKCCEVISLQLININEKKKISKILCHLMCNKVTQLYICYQPEFLVSLINRNWSEARQKIQARLYWGPCYSREDQGQVTDSLAFSLTGEWASWFLIWGEGRGVSKGGLGGLPPFRWWCVQGACTVPCFCSWAPTFSPKLTS